VARAAIDASEFARAREALAPFIEAPTQRVAMLMAEIERTEHGDSGKARAWTLRAVRARHDPAWTADGYVSDRWRPVSPVSGRLDAFQWQVPVSALPSDKSGAIEPSPFEQAMLATPHRIEPPHEAEAPPPAAQDNSPPKPAIGEAASPPAAEAVAASAPPPLFRARTDFAKTGEKPAPPIPAIIPIVRAPDDPGVDDEPDFAERAGPAEGQAGGWRGFLSRWGG